MSYKDKIQSMRGELRELYKAAPAATGGFSELSKAVKGVDTLSAKEKEYVALGIAVAQRCSDCINFHVDALT